MFPSFRGFDNRSFAMTFMSIAADNAPQRRSRRGWRAMPATRPITAQHDIKRADKMHSPLPRFFDPTARHLLRSACFGQIRRESTGTETAGRRPLAAATDAGKPWGSLRKLRNGNCIWGHLQSSAQPINSGKLNLDWLMKQTREASDEVRETMGNERLTDPERLRALDRMSIMDSPQTSAHQRAARLGARLLAVPVSLVSFVDASRQFFSAQTGLTGEPAEKRQTALSHSFCQHVVKNAEPLIVRDARKDPLLCDNAAVRDLNVVAYLGVPIRSPDGHVLGSFCAIDRVPRDWTEDDLAVMQDVAEIVESDLRLRETLEERDIVLQEMRHRVKNLFTIINSIMRMERTAHDTADALADSLGARFKALSDAHEMIVPVIHAGRSEGATTTLDALLRKLLAPHGNLRDSRISMDGDEVPVGAKAAVYLTLALHELATNSAKYGGLSSDDGRLSVHWHTTDEDQVEICWEETGQRWDTDASPLSGFGSRLLLIAIEGQLAGRIDTRIEPDRFVRTLHLPLARLHA